MWRKQLEGERVRKSCAFGSYGSDDDGSVMRYIGQPKLQRLSDSGDIERFLRPDTEKAKGVSAL